MKIPNIFMVSGVSLWVNARTHMRHPQLEGFPSGCILPPFGQVGRVCVCFRNRLVAGDLIIQNHP
jgi:hypothetical protein